MGEECLLCGGTGLMLDGTPCECGCKSEMQLPVGLEVPVQYQNVRFDKSFLRPELQNGYGTFMENLLLDCTDRISSFNQNILICAPPNSGKTVWAYTLYGMLYAKGREISKLMDLIQQYH